MEPLSFELSGRLLGDAAAHEEQGFVFLVGGVEYPCCRFQAFVVSGLVRRLLASDCCLSRICLKVSDDEHQFSEIVSLMNGQAITITPENEAFLEACARELENEELLSFIITSRFKLEDVSFSNVEERIRVKTENHIDCKDELDFLASHFHEAELDVLKRFSYSNLERVLTNPHLKLESEDQLYDMVSLLAGENDDYLGLLRYIEFAFLSESKLTEFLDKIFPDLVCESVWSTLSYMACRFCRTGERMPLMKSHRYKLPEFSSENGMLNGIMRHLSQELGGNPHEQGEISITASGTEHGQCHKLVDYGWNDYWSSADQANSFVQFDFKSRRVCLSHYNLKGFPIGHPISWTLEVSDDNEKWQSIDTRVESSSNLSKYISTFTCDQTDKFVRYVRLRQTGDNSRGRGWHNLCLSRIEFFGKLKNPEDVSPLP